MNLYRVGTPSVGETWLARFSYSRASGGLGTGVYAFRDREAAEQNIESTSPDKQLIVLRNALQNPIQPRTPDATTGLVRLSRAMDRLRVDNSSGEYTYEDALNDPTATVAFKSGIGVEQAGWGYGSRFVSSYARDALFDTPELRSRYGYDEDEFLEDFIEATREAEREASGSRGNTQPINHLLYPEFDGVAPTDGAGGNTGRDGCVVFLERVEKCVDRDLEYADQVPPGVLNACWAE